MENFIFCAVEYELVASKILFCLIFFKHIMALKSFQIAIFVEFFDKTFSFVIW